VKQLKTSTMRNKNRPASAFSTNVTSPETTEFTPQVVSTLYLSTVESYSNEKYKDKRNVHILSSLHSRDKSIASGE
jgi:hypothetical protein